MLFAGLWLITNLDRKIDPDTVNVLGQRRYVLGALVRYSGYSVAVDNDSRRGSRAIILLQHRPDVARLRNQRVHDGPVRDPSGSGKHVAPLPLNLLGREFASRKDINRPHRLRS